MATPKIVPVASSLYLADGSLGYKGGKTDLVGIFNTINAKGFPHSQQNFLAYARLVQGLGEVPFYIEIRDAQSDDLVYVSATNTLTFPTRTITVELALTFKRVVFPRPGIFLVQLYCHGQWVADARLRVAQA